ncbi:EamA family transporter [Lacrimispora sp. 38-1]|uniref:EamA family transporter n=1 Tax=Lacrimispora sp. 38-1 TaxID=3125778 RepID=UPI003CF6BA24
MWFWLSLVAILFWSGSDLFSKIGSKPDDKYSHWKMAIAVGTVMGIHAIIELSRGAEFRLSDILTYLPVSFLYIFAMILGYVGLRYVVLSVSTPICNSSGAVAALLCFLILKEAMSGLQFVAVALVCIGIFLLSVFEKKQDDAERMQAGIVPDRKYTHSFIAIFFPIFYCIIDGMGTFADALILDRYIKEEAANIAYEFTFLIMAVFAIMYVVFIKKQKIKLSAEKPKMLAGVFETAGQFAYIYALGDNAIVAAPLISSYCIFSLVWARIILKEKLSWKQYLVIAIAAIGIIILGMEG